ncbi:hypothetical protein [Nonomuraea dietziae]|uniref:hypothetical protein n=1 Tax=Nonomuraea dietziae TaxID=65515 RepID=UPI00341E0BEA
MQVPQGLSFAFRYLREGGVWFDDPQADEYDVRGGILHIARTLPHCRRPDPVIGSPPPGPSPVRPRAGRLVERR